MKMFCTEFENRLESLLDGGLEGSLRMRCVEHAESCPACGELLQLAGGADRQTAAESPEELTREILARTSGGACASVLDSLCDWVDEALPGTDRDLIELHLDSCTRCAQTGAVVEAMNRDLPLLAEWRTDPRFVADVLAVILPLEVRLRRWWRASWPKWVRRPRFALETAYIGSLVLMLVFFTPGSPLEAMPQRALGMVKVDPVVRFEAPIAAAGERAGAGARRAWESTGAPIIDVSQTTTLAVAVWGEELLTRIRDGWGTVRDGFASLLLEAADEEEPTSDTETEEER